MLTEHVVISISRATEPHSQRKPALLWEDMSELEISLGNLGLQEYFETLVSHGFNTWKDVTGISEDSLADLDFKLGHRRKLQREIASYEGKPYGQPLARVPVLDEGISPSPENVKTEPQQSMQPKRRKRLRPLKDPHAPLRPKTDYNLFVNSLRENPRVSEQSFVDISKLAGQQWKGLLPDKRAMWASFAAQQKNKYEVELASYKETEHYEAFQRYLRTRKAERSENSDKNILSVSQEQMECALPIFDSSDSSKPKDPTTLIKHDFWSDSSITLSPSEEQEHNPLFGGIATFSNSYSRTQKSLSQDSNYPGKQETDFSLYGESPPATSCDMYDIMSCQPLLDSGYRGVETGATSEIADGGPLSAQSFHSQALNPFHEIPWTTIWPFVETFLQDVNNHYYTINADEMIRQFSLATAPATNPPNHTMYILCICISIGCQLHEEGSQEMAVMWYDNGRRYLDSDDWGFSLNVMRAMALISIFHRNERPSTARHYLDTALRIGEANNLTSMTSDNYLTENTPSHEWSRLWNTIQTMDSGH